jgi:hypothetical protein
MAVSLCDRNLGSGESVRQYTVVGKSGSGLPANGAGQAVTDGIFEQCFF